MIFRILCKNWDLEKIVSFLLHEIGGIRIGRVKVLRGGGVALYAPCGFYPLLIRSSEHTYLKIFPNFFAGAPMKFPPPEI